MENGEEKKVNHGSILDTKVNYLRSADTIILVGSRSVAAVQKFSVVHINNVIEQAPTINIERLVFDNMGLLEALGLESISDRFTLTVVEQRKVAYNYLGCQVSYIEKVYDVSEPIVVERATISVKKVEKENPVDLSFMNPPKIR